MSMSWRPHQTTSRRKIITLQEWADYIGVSKNTILAWSKKYKAAYPKVPYDPHDIYSVLSNSRKVLNPSNHANFPVGFS